MGHDRGAGNHDHARSGEGARAALRAAGVTVLANEAVRAGPLAVGGLDGPTTARDDLPATLRAMTAVGGTPVLLTHSPDPFPHVPAWVGLTVAGHTHGGQIRLPLLGAPFTGSRHGSRYVRGRVTEAGRTLIVSAGLGTSMLPLRLGAVPDVWAIDLVGP